MDSKGKDGSEMEELTRATYTSVKCVLNPQVVNILNHFPELKDQLETSTGVKFDGTDIIIGKWQEVHEARMSLLHFISPRAGAKGQYTGHQNSVHIVNDQDHADEISNDPSLSQTNNELLLKDKPETERGGIQITAPVSEEDSSKQLPTAINVVKDTDVNNEGGNGNEVEELAGETYISIKCVLNPQLVNILNDFTEDVKVQLETSTGIKFDGTDSIIGKWQEIHQAHMSLLDLINSRASAKDQYTGHQNAENIFNDQDHADEISNDPSLSQTNNELLLKDKHETERGGIQITAPVSEEDSSKQIPTTVNVAEGDLHDTKDGLSSGNEELYKDKIVLRDESTSERSEENTTDFQQSSHHKPSSHMSEGKATEMQKCNLDQVISHSESSIEGTDSEYNNKNIEGTQIIGKCRHNPCNVRSKPLKFHKPTIQYIVKYLQNEVEDLNENRTFFVTFVENKDYALIKCCGENAEEAAQEIWRFENFCEDVHETLYIEDFPLRLMPDDDATKSLFSGINYIIYNKIVAVYEIKYMREVAKRLNAFYDTRCVATESKLLRSARRKRSPIEREHDLARKQYSAFDVDQPRHCLVIRSLNPYYWNHLSSHNQPFIKKLDALLKENDLTLREEGGKLVVEGQSLEYLKRFQAFLIKRYTMLSVHLKILPLKPNEVDLAKVTRKYPQTTVDMNDAGEIVLVSESDVIDAFVNEFGFTNDNTSEVTTERKPIISVPEDADSKTVAKIPCGFLINKNTKVFIHKCDITKLHVDAIVNPANERLSHIGGIAKAILDAAGPELEREGNEIIRKKGPIPVSKTEVTSAGRLPCRKVIHAVGPRWPHTDIEKQKKKCSTLLYETFINVLSRADKLGFKSIAMPPISSGIFGVPKDEVANAIFQALVMRKTTNLKEVHIVDITGGLLSLIAGTFLTRKRHQMHDDVVSDLRQDTVFTTIEKCLRKGELTELMIHNRIKTLIYQGDITQISADAILCSNDEKLSCSTGLAKSIADKEGRRYKKMCQKAAKDKRLQPADAICVKSSHHGLVIHVITPHPNKLNGLHRQYDDDTIEELLYRTFNNAIQEARKCNIRSLAISPVGAVQSGVPICLIASALCNALLDALTEDNEMQTIYIVCKNTELLGLVKNELSRYCIISTEHGTQTEELRANITGNQPSGGSMYVVKVANNHLPGYGKAGTIVILYNIPDGIQGAEHPHPGKPYSGTIKLAFLPDNAEGNRVLGLLRKAFDARLIFTVGQSAMTGHDDVVIWNDISHKTAVHGGPQCYGYPDPTYLTQVQEELAAKGIQ